MPECRVQYKWNVPAVVNGPTGLLPPPFICMSSTVGAPGSVLCFAVLVLSQVPLLIVWDVSPLLFFRVIFSPFLIVIEDGSKLVASNFTGFSPVLGLVVGV